MNAQIYYLCLVSLTFHSVTSFFDSLDCPIFNSLHCRADCTNIPTRITCESVLDEELHRLLMQYGNATSTPLRLTIKKSPGLRLSQRLFAPVIPQLWDLRIESDTIVNEIPSGSFNNLKNLRFLDLSENKIAHLHAEDFTGLSQIRGLKLERNPLIEIAAGVFDDLPNLQCIDLDDNALTCDCRMSWLKSWAVEHPELWEDDKEIYENDAKEDCDGDIPDCEYPPLMRDRNVSQIPADICNTFLTDIQCMDLQTHHCKLYCDNWNPMQIQCSNVGYSELHGLLQRYSKTVDRVLRLDISKSTNLVMNTSLWEPVKNKLIHLRVDHTSLVLRPGAFSNLQKLIFLEFDDSEIASVPLGAFDGLTSLRGLTFDDTNIEHIDSMAFGPLKNLVCLKLDEDEEQVGLCDCDMKWLQTWMSNHTRLFDDDILMYDFGLKVFCDGDEIDCVRNGNGSTQDDC